jgi:Holliday junction resolvasome RuvABC endonuclease subunit
MGERAVWGVDVGVKRTTLVALPKRGKPHVEVAVSWERTRMRDGELMRAIYAATCDAARRLAAQAPPYATLVERPAGRWPTPALAEACGVVLAALAGTLDCAVWAVPPSQWKRAALGFGNATKEQIMVAARRHVPDLVDQDTADAIMIAYAARQLIEVDDED